MADGEPFTGALFVAVPALADPVNELSQEEQAHVSLLWFGDVGELDPFLVDAIREHAQQVAQVAPRFTARVAGTAELGTDKAQVLLIESVELVELRQALFAAPEVVAAYMDTVQFPWWIPHLTISYGARMAGPVPEEIDFDGVGLWLGGQHERYTLNGSVERPQDELPDAPDDLLSSGAVIPPVLDVADLPMCVQFADQNPDARWYAQRRAKALGRGDLVPASWAVA